MDSGETIIQIQFMSDGELLSFKIQIMSDGSLRVTDAKGTVLEPVDDPEELLRYLNNAKHTVVTPMFTYIKTNSGVIIINGRIYRIP